MPATQPCSIQECIVKDYVLFDFCHGVPAPILKLAVHSNTLDFMIIHIYVDAGTCCINRTLI